MPPHEHSGHPRSLLGSCRNEPWNAFSGSCIWVSGRLPGCLFFFFIASWLSVLRDVLAAGDPPWGRFGVEVLIAALFS